MLEYIYICRHGFRSNWVDPSIKTGPTGMNRDPPLAAYGTEQAGRLAAFLSDPQALDPHPVPERVFCSPFFRCIETAVPTYQALSGSKGSQPSMSKAGNGIMLEHGVQEWYSTVNPDTGLHPRPAGPEHLAPLFPPSSIDTSYTSTLFPSRRGETLKELQDRADLFIEAWTGRVEEMGVKSVVIFAHAASVIALGRALTGDKGLDISAGCASTSLYRRKSAAAAKSASSSGLIDAAASLAEKIGISTGPGAGSAASSASSEDHSGVGAWEAVFLGRADYLENGVERDWSFKDAVIVDGEVIKDNGDRIPHPPEDQIPSGLSQGMEKYLRRGKPKPNTYIKELDEAGSQVGGVDSVQGVARQRKGSPRDAGKI